MTISSLNNSNGLDEKALIKYNQLNTLLDELRSRNIPENVAATINAEVDKLNAIGNASDLRKQLRPVTTKIVKLLEKELKLVPKNYYRLLWMVLGMTAFGLPLGVAFGTAVKNIGLLGIGLPIGMAIGLAVGSGLDKKALTEGRQLSVEIK